MIKPKIILHGAKSLFLEHAFSYFEKRFEVIAISDNDVDLVGTEHKGVPIVLPLQARSLNYDFIVICCASYEANKAVFYQLITDYMIEPRRIIDNKWVLGNKLLSLLYVSNLLSDEGILGDVATFGISTGYNAMYMNIFYYDRKLYLYPLGESESLIMEKMLYPENCIIRNRCLNEYRHDAPLSFVDFSTKEYEQTFFGLNYFYNQMSKGGVIFIHNYHDEAHSGVRKATEDFINKVNLTQFVEEDGALAALVKS